MGKEAEAHTNRTRRALMDAGYDLISERPLEAIPIDDIVDAASVGKGSFFNHFGDKTGFAVAMAMEVRSAVEAQVTGANAGLDDPIERLAGGMREVTEYALNHRKRTIAMLRMASRFTARLNPINDGVRADIKACADAGLLRPEAIRTGVLVWLGIAYALVSSIVEEEDSRAKAAEKLHDGIVVGLVGLGCDEGPARKIAKQAERKIRTSAVH